MKKNDNLEDYTYDFELIASMLIGEVEQRTNIRYKNIDDFEIYVDAIDVGYDSEDVIFKTRLSKLNTFEFNKKNRSQNGSGTDFKQDNVESIGSNCYNPTSRNGFIKCISNLTGRDCKK